MWIAIILCLLLYLIYLKMQLSSINRQLVKRISEKARAPINVELIDKELNSLVSNINRVLKEEENARLKVVREDKKLKELIANISHDLRTPLTAIKGYQQLMQKSDLDTDTRKKLEIAMKHADTLEKLITQFFKYSYYTTTEVYCEKFNLTNVLLECLAQSASMFEEKGIILSIKEEQVFVMADKKLTLQIISNLIDNCLLHSSGKVLVEISKDAVMSFKNPVFDKTLIDVSRIFDRFYIADKARAKSTGLGLSIVKMLTEQMEGEATAVLEENMLEIKIKLPKSTFIS